MLASLGIDTTPPESAQITKAIEQVEELLSEQGLDLHPHVRWLWETWAPMACEVIHPGFQRPDFSASVLSDRQQGPFGFLLPVGYDGHRDLLADMTQPAGDLYLYAYDYFDDQGIRLVFSGLDELMRYLITFFDEAERCAVYDGPFAFIAQRERLSGLLPPTIADDEKRPIDSEINTWPKRWRQHQGHADDADALRGATHSVAKLVAARAHGLVEATLVGRIQNLAGSGKGTVARLTDDSGSVEVHIPASAPRFDTSLSDTYEVDVVADQLVEPEKTVDDFGDDYQEVQRLALGGNVPDAAKLAAAMGFHVTGDHPVRVTAQRPIL